MISDRFRRLAGVASMADFSYHLPASRQGEHRQRGDIHQAAKLSAQMTATIPNRPKTIHAVVLPCQGLVSKVMYLPQTGHCSASSYTSAPHSGHGKVSTPSRSKSSSPSGYSSSLSSSSDHSMGIKRNQVGLGLGNERLVQAARRSFRRRSPLCTERPGPRNKSGCRLLALLVSGCRPVPGQGGLL